MNTRPSALKTTGFQVDARIAPLTTTTLTTTTLTSTPLRTTTVTLLTIHIALTGLANASTLPPSTPSPSSSSPPSPLTTYCPLTPPAYQVKPRLFPDVTFRSGAFKHSLEIHNSSIASKYENDLIATEMTLSGIGLMGNLIMLTLVFAIPRTHSVHGIKFIISVNVSSVITMVVVCFRGQLLTDKEPLCSIQVWLHYYTIIVNIYSRALAGLDRYIYISLGLKYHGIMTDRVCNISVGVLWTLAVFVAMAVAFFKMDITSEQLCSDTIEYYDMIGLKIVFLVVIFMLPILFICIIYFLIFKWAYTQIREIKTMEAAMENILIDSSVSVKSVPSVTSDHEVDGKESSDDGVKFEVLATLYRRLSRSALVIQPDEVITTTANADIMARRTSSSGRRTTISAGKTRDNTGNVVFGSSEFPGKRGGATSTKPEKLMPAKERTEGEGAKGVHIFLPQSHNEQSISSASEFSKMKMGDSKRVSFIESRSQTKLFGRGQSTSSLNSLSSPVDRSVSQQWRADEYEPFAQFTKIYEEKKPPSPVLVPKNDQSPEHQIGFCCRNQKSCCRNQKSNREVPPVTIITTPKPGSSHKKSSSGSTGYTSGSFLSTISSLDSAKRLAAVERMRQSYVWGKNKARQFQTLFNNPWINTSRLSATSFRRSIKNRYCYRVMKLVLVIAFIVFCNAGLWIPFCVVEMHDLLTVTEPHYFMVKLLYILGRLTCVVDPVVFGYMNSSFRLAVTRKFNEFRRSSMTSQHMRTLNTDL